MIRYALACDQGHGFDSWFRDGAAFDAQVARGLVTCPACGSANVGKSLMAPALARKGRADAGAMPDDVATPAPQAPRPSPAGPVALVSEKDRELRAAVKALRTFLDSHTDDVGKGFADEARRMHAGEIDHRAIRGEATGEEARALLDEGIAVHPLPVLPEERN